MATDHLPGLPQVLLVQSCRRGFHSAGKGKSPHPMYGMRPDGKMRSGRNGEGYYDPTASIAISRVEKERRKKHGKQNTSGIHPGRTGVDREVDPARNQLHPGLRGDGHLCTEARSPAKAADGGRGTGAGEGNRGSKQKTGGEGKCSKNTKRISTRTSTSKD